MLSVLVQSVDRNMAAQLPLFSVTSYVQEQQIKGLELG